MEKEHFEIDVGTIGFTSYSGKIEALTIVGAVFKESSHVAAQP